MRFDSSRVVVGKNRVQNMSSNRFDGFPFTNRRPVWSADRESTDPMKDSPLATNQRDRAATINQSRSVRACAAMRRLTPLSNADFWLSIAV